MRIGLLEGEGFVVNPTVQQMEASSLDLLLAGSASAVLMIEGFADFLPEEQLLEVCGFQGLEIVRPLRLWFTVVSASGIHSVSRAVHAVYKTVFAADAEVAAKAASSCMTP